LRNRFREARRFTGGETFLLCGNFQRGKASYPCDGVLSAVAPAAMTSTSTVKASTSVETTSTMETAPSVEPTMSEAASREMMPTIMAPMPVPADKETSAIIIPIEPTVTIVEVIVTSGDRIVSTAANVARAVIGAAVEEQDASGAHCQQDFAVARHAPHHISRGA
jgi:aspartate oxidase